MSQGVWSLVLETSGRLGRIGLFDGPEPLEVRTLDAARRNARDLIPTISAILSARGLTTRDLSRIVVGTGPGSYTGLRVGIMAAKTLAWSLSIPLFAVPTFVAIAQRVPDDAPTVEVVADALKGKVFCERLHRTGSATWESVEPLAILAFDDWLARVGDGAIVTGPGTTTYEPRLPATLARTAIESREADPSSLLELVRADAERWRSDLWTLEPLYMRGSYAEEAKRG